MRRTYIENTLFVILMAASASWTFSNEKVQHRWKRHIISWYRGGGPSGAYAKYSGADALAEFALAAAARGIKGIPPTEADLFISQSAVGKISPWVANLYRPLRPNEIPSSREGWVSIAPRENGADFSLAFPKPQNFETTPRLIVLGHPADAFVDTLAIISWSHPDDPKHLSGAGPAQTAYFERKGDIAMAMFPIGRLIEFSKDPTIAQLRVDLFHKSPGKITFLALKE